MATTTVPTTLLNEMLADRSARWRVTQCEQGGADCGWNPVHAALESVVDGEQKRAEAVRLVHHSGHHPSRVHPTPGRHLPDRSPRTTEIATPPVTRALPARVKRTWKLSAVVAQSAIALRMTRAWWSVSMTNVPVIEITDSRPMQDLLYRSRFR